MEIVDKHAVRKRKRTSKIKSLWITHDILMRKIHKRNYLKRKATVGNDEMIWQQYKHARNETNNAIRLAKRQYIIHNLEMNKNNPRKTWTWMLNDELSSRKCGKTRNIPEMKIENESINAATEMAEAFNDFFHDS